MYSFNREEYEKRTAWFKEARFGMFIHFGLYAIPARGEWVRSTEEMSKEEYMKYFYEFNPVNYDPKAWAKAAKEAGMQYVVMTAKHHDGFCLFDSQYTDFKSTNTPIGRDLVKEFVEAVRGEGLKVGLYFTLLDWYHEDYPHYGDRIHPMRNNENEKNDHRDFNRYLDYMHKQIREICTNYGKLDLLWFDFSYDDMRGEKWRATELIDMVRTLQPGVIIDNRLEVSGEGYGSLASGNPTPYHGDFVTPEQTTNAAFTAALARRYHARLTVKLPTVFFRLFYGEGAVLLTEGQCVKPTRLLEKEFQFQAPTVEAFFKRI